MPLYRADHEERGHRFIVLYRSEYRREAQLTLGQWCVSEHVDFSWKSCAAMTTQLTKHAENDKLQACRGRG